jgi:hypothetical protein
MPYPRSLLTARWRAKRALRVVVGLVAPVRQGRESVSERLVPILGGVLVTQGDAGIGMSAASH